MAALVTVASSAVIPPHELVHVGCFGLNTDNQCGFPPEWWDKQNITEDPENPNPEFPAWNPMEEASLQIDSFGNVRNVFGMRDRSYFILGGGTVFTSGRMKSSLWMTCTNYSSEGDPLGYEDREIEFVNEEPSLDLGLTNLKVDRIFGSQAITLVLTTSGALYASGENAYGQLGLGFETWSEENFTQEITQPINETTEEVITMECVWVNVWEDLTRVPMPQNFTIEDVAVCGFEDRSSTLVVGTETENSTRQVYSFGFPLYGLEQEGPPPAPQLDLYLSQGTQESLGYLIKISCGMEQCLALVDNSTHARVYQIGRFQIGRFNAVQQPGDSPQPVMELDDAQIVDVMMGDDFLLALSKNGSVFKWGLIYTQNIRMDDDIMRFFFPIPTLLEFPSDEEVAIEKMMAGRDYAFFLTHNVNETTNETTPVIWGWGSNEYGQLGYLNNSDSPIVYYAIPIDLCSLDESWFNLSRKVSVDWADASPLFSLTSRAQHNLIVWREHEKVNCTPMDCGDHGSPEPSAPCDFCKCNTGWLLNTTTKLCDVCDINRPLCQAHGRVNEIECRCECDLLYFGRHCDTKLSELVSRGTQVVVYYSNQAFFVVSTMFVSSTSIFSVIPGIAPFAQVFVRLIIGMMEQFQFIALIGRTGVDLGETFAVFSSFFGFALITVPIKSPNDLLGDFRQIFTGSDNGTLSIPPNILGQQNAFGLRSEIDAYRGPLATQTAIDTYSDIYGVTSDYLFLFSYLGIAILLICTVIIYGITALINIKKMRTPAERKKIKHKMTNSIIRVIMLGYNGLALTASYQLTKAFNIWLLPLVLIAGLTLAALIAFDIFAVVILVRNKLKDTLKQTKTLRRIGVLYEEMRDPFFWFITVIIARKFIIGVVTGLLSSIAHVQITILFGVQFIFTAGLVIYRPYQDKVRNILEIGISIVQTVCYCLVILALPGLWMLHLGDAVVSIVSPILIVLTCSSTVLYTAGIILVKIVTYLFGKKRIDDEQIEKELL